MTKVLNFPKEKKTYECKVTPSDFQFLICHAIRIAFNRGRSQGFLIGVGFACVVNLGMQYFFNHWIGN